MDLKIMYWENSQTVVREVTMGDTAKLDDDAQIPKINVIYMIFSHKVAGQDTVVFSKQEVDNYQVTLDERTNVSSMWGYDDDNGGWFRNQAPFASDGYAKPTITPGLFPYSRANYITWLFQGILLTQAEWDGTQAERDALK